MGYDFRDLTNMNIGPLGLRIKPSTLPATLRTLQGVVRLGFTRWGSLAFSLGILAAVAFQLRSIDFITLTTLVPTSALFWLAFAASYLATPVSEWAIFRGLWRLPVVGLLPLLHKQVTNNLVLGYMGETQFYLWAKRRAEMVASPFGAVKDVAILSALAGNVATIAVLALAYPMFLELRTGSVGTAIVGSVFFVMAVSIGITAFGHRMFTLRRPVLIRIFVVHLLRIAATVTLSALMWHLVVPDVAAGWWILLASVRLMMSRLPLVPNKDVALVGVAALFVGQNLEIVAAIVLVTGITVAAHVLVGIVLGFVALAPETYHYKRRIRAHAQACREPGPVYDAKRSPPMLKDQLI